MNRLTKTGRDVCGSQIRLGVGQLLNWLKEAWKDRQQKNQLQSGLRLELIELRYTMACVAFGLEDRFGGLFEKQFLEWCRPILIEYINHIGVHVNKAREHLKVIDGVLNMPEPAATINRQLARSMLEERERERSAKGITLRLQRYPAPLLDAKIAALLNLDEVDGASQGIEVP